MELEEIAFTVNRYYSTKTTMKALIAEMTRAAVELGQDQRSASNGRAIEFLEGYLTAMGMSVVEVKINDDALV